MEKELVIRIGGGCAEMVYDDRLASLMKIGEAVVTRASHVEPMGDGWGADMTPSGGPVLGPFGLRAEALEAERAWLRIHKGI